MTTENWSQALDQVAEGKRPAAAVSPGTEESAPAAETASETESTPAPAISAGKAAALAATVKRFPAYVHTYPGGQTTDANLQTFGPATIGSYEFVTDDSPEKVADYYQKELTGAGFTVAARNSGTNDNGATVTMLASSPDSKGNVAVSAEAQPGGKVKTTINFTTANP